MPLIRTIQIYAESYRRTKIGIWHLEEPETFFASGTRISCHITHPHKRLQHLAARYMLKALEPEFPLSEIALAPSGKPYLPADDMYFSLAHSRDYAVAITSRKYAVGIDVEEISPKIERVATKFLNPAELGFLDRDRQREQLTVCWSAKEAVYKWYGAGGIDFRQHMHLQPFPLMKYGAVTCLFNKDKIEKTLSVFYQIENDFVLTWLVDVDE